jgi:hypothetical protein
MGDLLETVLADYYTANPHFVKGREFVEISRCKEKTPGKTKKSGRDLLTQGAGFDKIKRL